MPFVKYVNYFSVHDTDAGTTPSTREDEGKFTIWYAKGWVKITNKEPDSPDKDYKNFIASVEIKWKINKKDYGGDMESRFLEIYKYDWNDKESSHFQNKNASWETVVPDSSLERLILKISDYDNERQNKK